MRRGEERNRGEEEKAFSPLNCATSASNVATRALSVSTSDCLPAPSLVSERNGVGMQTLGERGQERGERGTKRRGRPALWTASGLGQPPLRGSALAVGSQGQRGARVNPFGVRAIPLTRKGLLKLRA